ncbi:MAG: hypothetical protein ACK5LJ_07685 [Paracoccus sp. (in: a-proteobacteria)]
MSAIRVAMTLFGLLLANVQTGAAQDGRALAPAQVEILAEHLADLALVDRHAAAMAAESKDFAGHMAQLYLPEGGGVDWREEIARIHDPARVSALLIEAIERRLQRAGHAETQLFAAMGATGVSVDSDGQGRELAARIELCDPIHQLRTFIRLDYAATQGSTLLGDIRAMISDDGAVDTALASRLNRELAFARGFNEAGGFGFPTAPGDQAADLLEQLPDLRAEAAARTEMTYYAALAPLGEAGVGRIALVRQAPESRALRALMAGAEAEVLDQLAEESGRAAARRQRGNAL